MNKDLLVDGKAYISAIRAAKILGYATDYVGELARSGKIPARMVGRAWFVDLDALLEHKKNRRSRMRAAREARAEIAPAALVPPVSEPLLADPVPYLPALEKSAVAVPLPARSLLETLVVALVAVFIIGYSGSFVLADFLPSVPAAFDRKLADASEASVLGSVLDFFSGSHTSAKNISSGPIVTGGPANQETLGEILAGAPVKLPAVASTQSQSDLKAELEAYVRSQIALSAATPAPAPAPIVVYNQTFTSQVLGQAAAHTSAQGESITENFSQALSSLQNNGLITNPTVSGGTITGAAISGSTFSGKANLADLAFDNATGTNSTTTNLFATNGVFTSLTAGSLSVNSDTFTVGSQLNLVQSQNGTTQINARRATDTAPSGDFITYTNAAGDTPLFRVDNSGNIFAGGITNSGALTITSHSAPQFRVQYDSTNENTNNVTSSGVSTFGFNGTTPKALFTPQSNAADTFQFTDASSTPILNVDTQNKRVGIGTTAPQAPLDVRGEIFVRNTDGLVGSNDGVEIATDSSAPRVSLVQGGRYVGLFSGDAPGNTYLKNVAGGDLIFTGGSGGNTELARLTNSGQLGIGASSNLNGALTLDGAIGTQSEGDIFRQYDSGDAAWYPIIARYDTGNGSFPGGTYLFGDGANANVGVEKPGGGDVTSFHVKATTASFNNAVTVGTTLTATGGLSTLSNLLLTGSSSLQNLTFLSATGTSATTTNLFSTNGSFTNLTGTSLLSSSAIITNATTTNFFSTTASTTNLFTSALGIGTNSVNSSALVDLVSTTKGFLAPRMTDVQRDAIVSPATGLLIYNTVANEFDVYNGSTWTALGSGGGGSSQWTTSGANIYYTVGNIGVGTNQPTSAKIVSFNANSTALPNSLGSTQASSTLRLGTANSALDFGTYGATGAEWIQASNPSNLGTSYPILLNPNSDSTGFVGIGTTAPSEKLDVEGTGATNVKVKSTGAFSAGISLIPNNNSAGFSISASAAASPDLAIKNPSGTDVFHITNAGFVGIGTTNPVQKLWVEGLGSTGGVRFVLNDTDTGGHQWNFVDGGTAIQSAGDFSIRDGSIGATRMTIDTSGNVGIGTTNPQTKLDFGTSVGNLGQIINIYTSGNQRAGIGMDPTSSGVRLYSSSVDPIALNVGTISLADGTTFASKLAVLSSGNVGIGTTNPLQNLVISNGGHEGIEFVVPNGTDKTLIQAYNRSSSTYDLLSFAAGSYSFGIGGTPKVSIDSSGGLNVAGLAGTGNRCLKADSAGNIVAGSTDCATGGSGADNLGNHIATQNIQLNGHWLSGDGGNEGIQVDSSGNVGVGTASPTNKLTVDSGAIDFSGTTGVFSGSGSGIYQSATNKLTFVTAGNQRVSIDASGNVGIGTTTPQQPLSIAANSGASALQLIGRSADNIATLNFSSNSGGTSAFIQGNGIWLRSQASGGVHFSNSGTPSVASTDFTIEGMNVGIGTTSPSSLLAIEGSSGTDVAATIKNTFTAGGNNRYATLALSGNNGSIQGIFRADAAGLGPAGVASVILGATTNQALSFITNNTNRVLIDTSGNVGIGTTTTSDLNGSTRLNIQGPAGADVLGLTDGTDQFGIYINHTSTTGNQTLVGTLTNHSMAFITNDVNRMLIDASGHVGIGTTTPSSELTIARIGSTRYHTELDGANIYIDDFSGTSAFSIGTPTGSDDNIQLTTAGSPRLYVANGGNIGIGTTTPAYELDLGGGTTVANRLAVRRGSDDTNQYLTLGWNSLSTHRDNVSTTSNLTTFQINQVGSDGTRTPFYIETNGSVGIGTTAPAEQLSVKAGTAPKIALGVYTDTGGRGIALRTSDYAAGTTGSSLRFGMGAGTGDTYASIQQHLAGENGTYGNIALNPSGGNVGIGTTTPDYKLTVGGGDISINNTGGTLRFYNGGTQLGYLNANASAGLIMEALQSKDMTFKTATAAQMTISGSTGNVGIGTTNPTAKLEVNGTIKITGGSGGGITFADGSTMTSSIAGGTGISSATDVSFAADNDSNGSGVMSFATHGSTRMTIANTGGIGIGTASPNKNGWESSELTIEGINNRGALEIGSSNTTGTGGTVANIAFYNSVSSNLFYIRAFNDGATNQGSLEFIPDNAGTNITAMHIGYNGNVGIGTTAPGVKLSLGATTEDTAGSKIAVFESSGSAFYGMGLSKKGTNYGLGLYANTNTTASPQLFLENTGNVGIGTTTPIGLLTLYSGGTNDTLSINRNANTSNGMLKFYTAGTSDWILGERNTTDSDFHLYNYGTSADALVVQRSTGNIGIGTTNPDNKLQVAGNAHVNGAFIIGQSGVSDGQISVDGAAGNLQLLTNSTIREYISAAGLVGIGTTAPSSPLTVFGSDTSSGATNTVLRLVGANGVSNKSGGLFFKAVNSTTLASERIAIIQSADQDTNARNLSINPDGGNVGIGTTNPGNELEVVGSGPTSVAAFKSASTDTTFSDLNGALVTFQNTSTTTNNFAGFMFRDASGTGNAAIMTQMTDQTNHAGDLVFGTRPASGSVTEAMRITSAGKVGIGTTNPGAKLQVSATNGAAAILAVADSVGRGIRAQTQDFAGSTGSEYILEFGAGSGDTYTNLQAYKAGGTTFGTLALNASGGNVGIGTTAPTAKLEVAGGIKISGAGNGLTFPDGTTITSNASAGTGITSATDLSFAADSDANGSGVMSFATHGSTRLTISNLGDTTAGGALSSRGALAADVNNMITMDYVGTNYGRFYVNGPDTSTNGSLRFVTARSNGTNSLTPMVIDSSGNVGIGTTTPNVKLEIANGGNAFISLKPQVNHSQIFINRGDDTSVVGTVYESSASSQVWNTGMAESSIGTGNGYFIGTNADGSSAKLLIDTSGNVGIGTTAPQSALQVSGANVGLTLTDTSAATDSKNWAVQSTGGLLRFRAINDAYSSGINALVINRTGVSSVTSYFENGNVGIGTTTPATNLHIDSGGAFLPIIRLSAQGQNAANIGRASSFFTASVNDLAVLAPSGQNLFLGSGNNGYETITSSGFVGIGTTTPAALLTLQQGVNYPVIELTNGSGNQGAHYIGRASNFTNDASASDLAISAATGSNIVFANALSEVMRISSTGNVGIGTTAPGARLDLGLQAPGTNTALTYQMQAAGNSNWVMSQGSIYDSTSVDQYQIFNGQITGGTKAAPTFTGSPTGGYYIRNFTGAAFANSRLDLGYFSGTGAGQTGTTTLSIVGNNVGIGTTTPAQKLDVAGSEQIETPSSGLALKFIGRSGDDLSNLLFYGNNASTLESGIQSLNTGLNLFTSIAQPITFTPNSAEAMRITSAGLVGIGTTNPGSKLEVNGNTTIDGTSASVLTINGASGSTAGITINTASTSREGQIFFQQAATDRWQMGMAAGSATPNWYLYSQGVGANVLTANYSTGNVGIGTTAPNAKLNILAHSANPSASAYTGMLSFDTTDAQTSMQIGVGDASARGGWIQTANEPATGGGTFPLLLNPVGGNVGIGTTNPGSPLEIKGVDDQISLVRTTAGATTIGFYRNSDKSESTAGDYWEIGQGPGGDRKFGIFTNTTGQVLTINTSGNVGIGTTNPSYPLDVQKDMGNTIGVALRLSNDASVSSGTPTTRLLFSNHTGAGRDGGAIDVKSNTAGGDDMSMAFWVRDNANTLQERMRINAAGNVGIGTTNPGGTLDILGANGSRTFGVTTNASANLAMWVGGAGNINGVSSGTGSAAAAILHIAEDTGSLRSINAAGSINASGADYAEYFYQAVPGSLEAGELVSLDPASGKVVAAQAGQSLVGIVSANPGFVGNDLFDPAHPGNTALVGLTGQLPTKVTGPVAVGDPIALSSVSGVGRKALPNDAVIGTALTAWSGPGEGTVNVFIDKTANITAGFSLNASDIEGLRLDLAAATSSIADLQNLASTTAARVDALTLRVSALETASSTDSTSFTASSGLTFDSTSTPTQVTSDFFSAASLGLRQGIENIAAASVEVTHSAIYAVAGTFDKIFAREVHTDEVCISDQNGETCVTRSQLDTMLAQSGQSGTVSGITMPNDVMTNAQSSSNDAMTSGGTATSTATSTDSTEASSTPAVTTGSGDASSTPSTDTATSSPTVADAGTATSTTP